jgi:hypothetical protein
MSRLASVASLIAVVEVAVWMRTHFLSVGSRRTNEPERPIQNMDLR